MNPQSQYRLGLILVTGSAIAWSTAGYFTRLIPLDNWTLLFWRGVFAALGLLLLIAATQRRAAWRQFREMGMPGWLFAAISGLGMVCFISSLTLTSVAHVAIIYGTVPFVAAGASWLMLRERPAKTAAVCSLAALIGVAVMVGFGRGEGSIPGDLLAFGMTLSMAGMMVISRRHPGIPTLPAACLSALLSGIACWPLSRHGLPPAGEMSELALFGLVNSAVGIALFTMGAKLLPAIETGLIGALDAPLAPVWVWLAFGETPGRDTIIGGILVFGAVLGHILLGARSRGRANAAQSSLENA
jgi:drug/metabolite transporter (DMT)-like permease